MDTEKVEILQRALSREKAARKEAEGILEKKSLELFNTAQKLKHANRKLEFLLGQKSSQLKGVFENINDAYLIMELNGNVIKVNQAAIDIFGYDLKKESFNVQSLIYSEDHDYSYSSFNELYQKGIFSNYTARVVTKSKEIKWVQINSSIIYDDKKKPIAAQGIIRDITKSKFMTEFIEEQKTQLDTIVEHAPFGIALTQNNKILKVNRSLTTLLGYTEEELLQKTIKDLSYSDDLKMTENYMNKMISGETNHFVIEKRYVKKDGSIIWAKSNISVVRNEEGEIKFQIAIFEDITSKREKKLILDMIQNLTHSILGKVNIYEISWEIVCEIAGYLGTKDCTLYINNPKKNRLEQVGTFDPQIESPLKIDIGKGIIGEVALSGIAKINNENSIDIGNSKNSEIAVPIVNENKVIGVIESKHSDKNYFTKEHITTLENIARLVSMQLKSALHLRERRKVEVENTKLLTKLEHNNKELQEYAHIVSHDLKSPLRSINALFSFIKEDNQDKLDEESLQNIQLIDNTLEKMEQLISDVLAYSSVDKRESEKEIVDLNILINDLKKLIYLPKNIELKILTTLPTLKTDQTKIQQVFQNLISNAVKFNDKELGLIEIDVEQHESYYQFSIKDNGMGIDEKYFDQIFKIFNSLKKSKESSGIGLSIVKKIIDHEGGKIWLESEKNKFTTFFFTIPK
ncbi:PAS domain S-box protein [Flavicella sediminum]|uniref:PAS domain S-box protein n=1 Tax=Flavicella sediminum TaxID=2585141 RepID=UPI0011242263|nr:PAS domain S-box protein [Flavicella sediminum]